MGTQKVGGTLLRETGELNVGLVQPSRTGINMIQRSVKETILRRKRSLLEGQCSLLSGEPKYAQKEVKTERRPPKKSTGRTMAARIKLASTCGIACRS